MRSRTLPLLTIAAALAVAQAAHAAAPSIGVDGFGRTQIDFESPPIFDFAHESRSVADGIEHTESVTHDAAGRINGHFLDTGVAGGPVTLETSLSGTIRRRGGRAVVVQRLRSAGDLGNGDLMESVGVSRGQITGSGPESMFVGTISTRSCITLENPITGDPKRLCKRTRIEQSIDFSHAGNWRLRLTLLRDGRQVVGLAELTVGTALEGRERTAALNVRGTLAGDVATLRLLPARAPKSRFGSLVLRGRAEVGATDELILTTVDRVAGTVLGQRFDEETR